MLLKRFADQVIVPLPALVIEPVKLHDRFMAWMEAMIELGEAERALHGPDAFDELIASKRRLEKYIGFLRNRARNAIEIAHEVRENPRLENVIRDLRADVLKYPASYARGGGTVPFIVLTTFEFSRYLKATL